MVSGAYEAVEALVARWRVPVDVPAADGATALHIAAYTGHLRIVCPRNIRVTSEPGTVLYEYSTYYK